MSAPFIVPFNWQPFATGRTASSYTVTADYYAEVTICIGLAAGIDSFVATNSSLSGVNVSSSSVSETIKIMAKAGDIIAFTASAASGSMTSGNIGAAGSYSVAATKYSTATITLNGSSIAVFNTPVTVSASATTVGSNQTVTIANATGSASVVIHYSEFPIIS